MVTINSGANSQPFPVAGRTVGYVRDRFGEILAIATGAQAYLNGTAVDDETLLAVDDSLLFAQTTAEKGA